MVLYSYTAQDENDVSVERGQCVTVLNADDPDWFWVSRYDQCEGFVPAGFIYPLDAIQRQREWSILKRIIQGSLKLLWNYWKQFGCWPLAVNNFGAIGAMGNLSEYFY